MWYVYADLTPFKDRWGDEHTRLISTHRFKVLAKLSGLRHVMKHEYGKAWIMDHRLTTEELEGL